MRCERTLAAYVAAPRRGHYCSHVRFFLAGWWSTLPQVQAALRINILFLLGAALAPVLAWGLTHTRWGLILQTVGDSADAARAPGYSVTRVRWVATAAGGCRVGKG